MSQLTKASTLYLVHALDAPETGYLREKLSTSHRQYMLQHRQKILIGGPLLNDEGLKRIGSAFVIQAKSREQVNDFMKHEPYSQAGLFESVIIRLFEGVMFESALLKEEPKNE